MIFNSLNFLGFFLVVYLIYYFVLNEKTKLQNHLLLIASYYFYSSADWKIVPILILTTCVYYFLGIAIQNARTEKRSDFFSTIGVLIGVGSLIYFKYTNFFIDSFLELFEGFGLKTNLHTFSILIPLGISFYIFRLLSYMIDLKRHKYDATTDFVVFATYIAFFPCLLSGPIDRPNTFIPQLNTKRTFNYDTTIDGLRQILWGLFKKMVVADNIASVTNEIWGNISLFSGSTLFLGAILYVFQMYADFSGYTDMAIGVGKLLGFKISVNFKYPLFALNIADFWRRWHITLTSWLTDYVFMPLNVKWRDFGKWGTILAVLINFVLVGLWHGANWTFAVFGLYHGLLFIPFILSGAFTKKTTIHTSIFGLPVFKDFLKIVLTFLLVTFGLVIFRAESLTQCAYYLSQMFSTSLWSMPKVIGYNNVTMLMCILFVALMIFLEWQNRDKEYGLVIHRINNRFFKYATYIFLFILVYYFGMDASAFIYFQF